MTTAEPLGDLTSIQRDILDVIRRLTEDRGRPPAMREVLEYLNIGSTGALSYQYRRLEAKGYMRRETGRPRTVVVRLPGEPPFPPVAGQPRPPRRPKPSSDQGQPREPVQPGPGQPGQPGQPGDSGQPGRRPADGPETAGQPAHGGQDEVVWVPIAGRISAGAPVLAEQAIDGYLPLPREVVGTQEGVFMLEVTGDSMIGVGIFSGDWVVVRPLFQPPQNGDIVAATIDGFDREGTVKTYRKVGRQVWLMPQNAAHTPIPGGKAEFAGKVIAVLRRV
jgi:repressor LexA